MKRVKYAKAETRSKKLEQRDYLATITFFMNVAEFVFTMQ